ncbi:MAG TPA: hypothetical protein VEH81_15990 [Ktedonobacteraceae bacterium]|nr:hypothetical protein [Ktedonobacteraceae bacterium]
MRKTCVCGLLALAAGTVAMGGYLLVVLPWQHRWGATDEEVLRALPGDNLVPHPDIQWTRAITVKAKATALWPWLLQIGHGRGGYYSYPWLETLMGQRVKLADQIIPAWQHLQVGDIIPAEPGGKGYRVMRIEPHQTLVLGVQEQDKDIPWSFTFLYQAFTWAFVLEQVDSESTRLIMRMRARMKHNPLISLAYLFIDFGAFFMKRRMLLGLKQRAEQLALQAKTNTGEDSDKKAQIQKAVR